jgi:fatty-acyl-CoA synthase
MSTTHEHYVKQLLTHFDADPDRAALVSGGVTLTAGELADATRRAAAAMARRGVEHGDVVCVLTERNTAATLILQWAANLVGAVAAHVRWVHPAGPDDELRAELRRAVGARMLAVDPPNEDRARDLLPKSAERPMLGVLGPGGPDTVDLTADCDDDVPPCADLADDDLAMITQTRLPNGRRKGMCWTFGVKNDMVASAAGRRGINVLITSPLIHSDGSAADDPLASGGLVVLQDGFKAGDALRAIAEYRINRLSLGAPQLYALAEHPDRPATDLSSLTELYYMGSPSAPRRLHEARKIFGPALIRMYGTTETGTLSKLAPDDHGGPDADGTVGRPLNPAALSIRHPETGEPLPAGELGEIYAQPRWPWAGYWHEPRLAATPGYDGWVGTGDLGHLDADGYLHLRGRIAFVMEVKGIQIHPEDVEGVLNQASGVFDVAVCDVQDPDGVRHIYAGVLPKPGATLDLQELRRHVAEALSDDHVPDLIEIRQKLPVTGWGKPDRVQLRHDARAALTQPVSRV